MRILMAMQSLSMGGAEKFFTNLALALHEHHDVTCYIPLHGLSDPALAARLSGVKVEHLHGFTPLTYRAFYKLAQMFRARLPHSDLEGAIHSQRLRRLQEQRSFEIVNAHLMPASRQVCAAFRDQVIPITKSDHGDMAQLDPAADAVVLDRLQCLICPAEANAIRTRALPWRTNCRITNIPYGYRPSASTDNALAAFDGITFGMVARGVEDKGWREAIAASRLVRSQFNCPIRLVLVGEGPAIESLRGELSAEDLHWVMFAGQQAEPERWVRGFDVALLPTCLPEESLPNSIIEYLACGKPVIATAVGGIPEMTGKAGILVSLTAHGRADVTGLTEAMGTLLDRDKRAALADAASDAFARFDMATCTHAYEALFASLLSESCGP